MPSGNKPKRLDRAWAWRVGRRKKQLAEHLYGKVRSRAKRPKKKSKASIFS